MKGEDVELHTPGPWKVETGVKTPHWILAANKDIAMVLSAVPSTRETLPRDANARLIAAAPELLVALEAMLHTEFVKKPGSLSEFEIRADVLEQAREAIRRAKGLTL